MKKTTFFLTMLVLVAAGLEALAAPACPNGQIIAGVCFPANTGLLETSVDIIILALLRWITLVFASIAVIMLVICGIKYLTSAGDQGAVESAKSCVKWSIVGIIVALGAMVVIRFVYTTLLGI
jgi:uncharacterized membrane protein